MRANSLFKATLALGLAACAVRDAGAEVATEVEMELVCQNQLSYVVYHSGGWAGDLEPKIQDVQQIIGEDGETVLAHCFSIAPAGYIVVPVLKELPPIKLYSEVSDLDVNATGGITQLLRDVLEHRIRLYVWRYGSMDASQPLAGDVLLVRENRREWDRFLADTGDFSADLAAGVFPRTRAAGPLLSTWWVQGSPYNDDCPTGHGGGRTLVGCVATAAAQVMRYHQWPPYGVGSHSYTWDGDDSCGAAPPLSWCRNRVVGNFLRHVRLGQHAE